MAVLHFAALPARQRIVLANFDIGRPAVPGLEQEPLRARIACEESARSGSCIQADELSIFSYCVLYLLTHAYSATVLSTAPSTKMFNTPSPDFLAAATR